MMLGRPWDALFWALTMPWSRLLARVWSGPYMHRNKLSGHEIRWRSDILCPKWALPLKFGPWMSLWPTSSCTLKVRGYMTRAHLSIYTVLCSRFVIPQGTHGLNLLCGLHQSRAQGDGAWEDTQNIKLLRVHLVTGTTFRPEFGKFLSLSG